MSSVPRSVSLRSKSGMMTIMTTTLHPPSESMKMELSFLVKWKLARR